VSARVEAAKRWLLRYLEGDLSGAELEAVEREDLLFKMVAILERHERDWLRARLLDPSHARDARLDVQRSLTGTLRHFTALP
jgi:hypothetical protein